MSTLDVLKAHAIQAKKSLGQNFLIDQNIQLKIVKALTVSPQDIVLEVGPGIGSLTTWIIDAAPQKLFLIEKDATFVPILQSLFSKTTVSHEIHQADALDVSLKELHTSPLKVISNLPYNISSPLIIKWIKEGPIISEMVLMIQKEVAERIVAKNHTKNYGRLSVLCQWLCECEILFHVPPHVFRPQPKVTSTVIKLRPKKNFPSSLQIQAMEKLTHLLFQQRRKMLKGILKSHVEAPESFLEALHISPTVRPENLSLEEFEKLSKAVFDS